MKKLLLLPLVLLLISSQNVQVGIVSYIVDLKKADVEFFWKDVNGSRIATLSNLKNKLESEHKKILCLMNAGMFKKDFSPQGLFVEHKKTLANLDVSDAAGNFYLKPNGVFYVNSNGTAAICETSRFKLSGAIEFATQSGPMLLIDGNMHKAFKEGSTNLNIRNGVGILPNGGVLLAISDEPINFYDFAQFFKDAGCKNALYLDGFVSRAYIPEKKRLDSDGNFGPMIAVISKD